jgi:hypothetical protein
MYLFLFFFKLLSPLFLLILIYNNLWKKNTFMFLFINLPRFFSIFLLKRRSTMYHGVFIVRWIVFLYIKFLNIIFIFWTLLVYFLSIVILTRILSPIILARILGHMILARILGDIRRSAIGRHIIIIIKNRLFFRRRLMY